MASHRMILFNAKDYDIQSFNKLKQEYSKIGIELVYEGKKLDKSTMQLAKGYKIVCLFVNDKPDKAVIEYIKANGTELIALRCAGFDGVDLDACKHSEVSVARVPVYSPNAVAEHAVALTMALNRHLLKAHEKVSKGDFTLSEEVLGFDLVGKTVGLLGTGNIGRVTGKIFLGFGCKILCYDVYKSDEFAAIPGVTYGSLEDVISQADVLSLHLPLLPTTKNIINEESLKKMKKGAILVNTSRGGLVDTAALLKSIKSGHLGSAGLDVYENESKYFFEKHSNIEDKLLKELMECSNVLLTAHQAFFTTEALTQIANVTLKNVHEFVVEGKKMDKMTNTVIKMD